MSPNVPWKILTTCLVSLADMVGCQIELPSSTDIAQRVLITKKNQKRGSHFVSHVAKVVGNLVAKLGQHSHVGSLIGKKKGVMLCSF